ncbi:hypothetical protein KTE19_10420 [Lentilactobacillus sp. IMAU92037]|uniref:hypothetical protein n=1 Tax=Lentilactobacillus dabitei TaxID=2831523 RepID=UPI001C27BE74|nr:hypothetical protein [Lentilactobacillus dabitei]MBU9790042.1 hypothetical protein [Lentilactobacillus dabitei]MBV0931104.1 hypothetical protein [Lentilactobacillus dabitei]
MDDDKLQELIRSAIQAATVRHNERVKSGRYNPTAGDSTDQLAQLVKNGDKASMEYANSLVYEVLKLLLKDSK